MNVALMDGLAFVREMRDRGAHRPPIGELIGFTILEIGPGSIRVSGRPTARHYNPLGVVHGGFAGTLMDLALGLVSITMLADMEQGVTTTDLGVKYLRPIFESTGTMYCAATVVHSGKKVIVAEARLVDESDLLYATAQSTCLVVPRQQV